MQKYKDMQRIEMYHSLLIQSQIRSTRLVQEKGHLALDHWVVSVKPMLGVSIK